MKANKITASEIISGKFYHNAPTFTHPVIKRLNADKIKTIEDVKRVLNYLNITAEVGNGLARQGYEEVKDLFE